MRTNRLRSSHPLLVLAALGYLASACGSGGGSGTDPAGSTTRTVPDVISMTEANARAAIVAAGLVVGTESQAASPTVAAGTILGESPPAGTSVAAGTQVDLVVSTGPVPFTLQIGTSTATVPRGARGELLVTVVRLPGFDGVVTVSADEATGEIRGDATALPAGHAQGTLTITATPDATEGASRTVHVVASGAGASASADLIVTVGSPQRSSQELIREALDRGDIDRATSLLYRAYAMFGDPRLPPAYLGSGPGPDHGLPVEASAPDLPPDAVRLLAPFTVRPTDPSSVFNLPGPQAGGQGRAAASTACPPGSDLVMGGWRSMASPDVPIRVWTQCGADAAKDVADLEAALARVKDVWMAETSAFSPPLPDAGGPDGGGDTAIDVYLLESGQAFQRSGSANALGNPRMVACAWPSLPIRGMRTSGYLLLRKERLGNAGFKSDLAHEFFHVVQYGYNQGYMFSGGVEHWFVEASATWAEAQFVPATSGVEVHPRFTNPFQTSTDSLHGSYAPGDARAGNMYAAYIYPFFAVQQDGPGAIVHAWSALAAATSHTHANQLLDGVFAFGGNFRTFAVRNLNYDLPGVLDKGQRYVAVDPRFPDGVKPTMADDQALSSPGTRNPAVQIAPLRAAYHRYTVSGSDIQQVVFRFAGITPRDALDVDGIVKIAGQSFQRKDYDGKDEVTFCRSRPSEKLEEILLVLSNHAVPLDQAISGSFEVEASKDPCADYAGTFDFRSSDPAMGFTATGTLEFVLGNVDRDPQGRVVQKQYLLKLGSVTVTSDVDLGDSTCTLDQATGAFPPSSATSLWFEYLNPSFPANSFTWAVGTVWTSPATCRDKAGGAPYRSVTGVTVFVNPRADCADPLPMYFPFQDPAQLQGSFTGGCPAAQVSWSFQALTPP